MKKTIIVIGCCFLLMLSFFSGCINIPDEFTQFSIQSFEVEPSIINQGEYANLSWVVINASSVTIDNGIGSVALIGHQIIQPTQTTTYKLIALKSNTSKQANVTIYVRPSQQPQAAVETINDTINDVSIVDYLTGETKVITTSPDIVVANLDIVKATYTKKGIQATLTLQVKGNIENRGKIIDSYSEQILGTNAVQYGFQLTTSRENYMVNYSNNTGQISFGTEQINLTPSNFTVAGDTLTIRFPLVSADETYENLSVTTTFIKANFSTVEDEGLVYLSDVAPNPPLKIIEAYAPDIGSVGESIQFNGSIQPLTGQPPYSYLWDFGDQSSSTLLNPTHVYAKPGHYTYIFTVTDHAGDTDSEARTITITA